LCSVILGINTVSKYIGSLDPTYASLFLHESWRELLEKAEPGKSDVGEIVSRISQYLNCSTDALVNLPVAEAMVTYKERRCVMIVCTLWKGFTRQTIRRIYAINLFPLSTPGLHKILFIYFHFSSDEESSQVFVPFVSDVRVGSDTSSSSSFASASHKDSEDNDDYYDKRILQQGAESEQSSNLMSPSALQQQDAMLSDPMTARLTPPSSPHVGKER
jgi:hypothetical protein